MLASMRMPKCTESTARRMAARWSMGAKIRMMDEGSMTLPASSRTALTHSRNAVVPSSLARIRRPSPFTGGPFLFLLFRESGPENRLRRLAWRYRRRRRFRRRVGDSGRYRGFASAAPLRFLRQHRAPASHFRLQEFAELFWRAVLRD